MVLSWQDKNATNKKNKNKRTNNDFFSCPPSLFGSLHLDWYFLLFTTSCNVFFAKDTFRNWYSYELKNINIHTTKEHCTAVMQMSKKMDCLVPYYYVSNLCTSIAPCGFIGHQALGCESSASATLLPEHTTASNINHFQGHRMASHRP